MWKDERKRGSEEECVRGRDVQDVCCESDANVFDETEVSSCAPVVLSCEDACWRVETNGVVLTASCGDDYGRAVTYGCFPIVWSSVEPMSPSCLESSVEACYVVIEEFVSS